MRMNLVVFVLAASLAAFGQGRSGGRSGSPPMSETPPMGSPGMGMPGHRQPGPPGTTSGNPNSTSRPSGTSSRESPDKALSQNRQLDSKLQSMLPEGTTPQEACSGFKTVGECVAAIHVSHNLDIPFNDLKSKMTGSSHEKLGKAIQDLKPTANAKAEEKKAKQQTEQDLKQVA